MRVLAACLLMIFLGAAACADSQVLEWNGFCYTWNRQTNTAEITGYTGSAAEVTVPEKLDGAKVVAIGERAFQGQTGLVKVVLQAGITTIGYGAFSGCTALEAVTLPESLTAIGSAAFENTGIAELSVPGSVTRIGERAFSGCSALEHLTLNKGIAQLGTNLFESSTVYADGQKTVRSCGRLKTLLLPDGVTQISDTSLAGLTELQVLGIGEGISSLPSDALMYCTKLQRLSLPESLTDTDSLSGAGIPAGTVIYGKTGSAALNWAERNGHEAHEISSEFMKLTAAETAAYQAGDAFDLRDLAALPGNETALLSAITNSSILTIDGETVRCTGSGTAVLTLSCPDMPEAGTARCTVTVYAAVTDFAFSAGGVTGKDALAVNLNNVSGSTLRISAAAVQPAGTDPEYTWYWRMDSWETGKLSRTKGSRIEIGVRDEKGQKIRHDSGIVMAVSKSGIVRAARIVLYTYLNTMTLGESKATVDMKHTYRPWVRFSLDSGYWGPVCDAWYGVLPVPDGTCEQSSSWNPDWEPENMEKVPIYLPNLYTMTSGSPNVVSVESGGVLRANQAGTAVITIRSADRKKSLSLTVTVPERKTFVLPSGLTELSAGALQNTGTNVVIVPDKVRTIGDGAFAGCRNLVTVEVPKCFSDSSQWQAWFDEGTDAENIVVVRN